MTTQYKYNGYSLTLRNTYNYDSYGKAIIRYVFRAPDNEIIFMGSDFHASPMNKPEGKASAGELLGFLTLQKGDTDSEYFDNYTPRQLAFRDNEAESLQMWGMGLEGDTE